ncbi:2-polyprenylphenol 6-hydroxylase [Emcibacter nanhaiensis]|uniref:2-polyprenylphenol 6-hydroxylase n=1 Tax=Emcibacter nanhaiensis TaxID=1505037 RepID=A0A501PM37_9PROT|nr:2-polyprenylphenol 6-hydroxylase [Emcibacter nanhaiensis]TPD61493.1 2-polyprenylphenol 6-hydroxylase [Emcibacter nanhaiensis]
MFRSLRHIGRLVRVGYTLAQYDALTDLLNLFGEKPGALDQLKTIKRIRPPKADEEPNTGLVLALQSLGPTFIKFGQALATRPDLIGAEVALDLMRLQDRVAPFPGEEAQKIIARELGGDISEFYSDFEVEPVAAASMAQVHRATTTDGRKVAVKVLRPGIEQAFARDLESFEWLARLVERFSRKSRRLRPTKVIETISETISVEMDFRYEAAASSQLRENMAYNSDYDVPKVDWDRTGRQVLTTEWVEGIAFSDKAALEASGIDRRRLAENLVQTFLAQALDDGFFHADLHQGNLFAREGSKITAIDFGIMGRLDRKTRRALAEILLGFLNQDYDRIAQAHFDIGYVPPDQSLDKFKQALRAIGDPVIGKPVNEISIGKLLAQLFETTETFNMQTQPQLLLLQKTMVTAEGVALDLYPGINMWETSRPIIERWMRNNLGPQAQIREVAETILAAARKVPKLVEDLEQIADAARHMQQLTSGRQNGSRYKPFLLGFAGALTAGVAGYVLYILFN